MNVEKVLEIASEIHKLDERREMLVRQLTGLIGATAEIRRSIKPLIDDSRKEAMETRVRKLFENNPKSIMNIRTIRKYVAGRKKTNISPVLTKLIRKGIVERTSKGSYCLKTPEDENSEGPKQLSILD